MSPRSRAALALILLVIRPFPGQADEAPDHAVKIFAFLFVALAPDAFAATPPAKELTPLLAQPDKVVFASDFSKPASPNKAEWQPRQGTRWAIEDGVLRGRESSPEYQAKKPHHKGLEPRISALVTPPEFVAKLSVRFCEGAETAVVPFVEFGHHIVRIRFSAENGLDLLADYESLRVAHAPDFKWETGKWYHALAELKGEEFLIQFQNGPTLYAKHPVFKNPAPSGGSGLGLAGPRGGIAELDNVTLWTVKPGKQKGWKKHRATFPTFEPVQVREKPKK